MRMELRWCCRAAVLFQILAGRDNIIGKPIGYSPIEVRAQNHAKADYALGVWRHLVSRQHPTILAHFKGHVELVEVGYVLIKRNRDHRNPLRVMHDGKIAAIR